MHLPPSLQSFKLQVQNCECIGSIGTELVGYRYSERAIEITMGLDVHCTVSAVRRIAKKGDKQVGNAKNCS